MTTSTTHLSDEEILTFAKTQDLYFCRFCDEDGTPNESGAHTHFRSHVEYGKGRSYIFSIETIKESIK